MERSTSLLAVKKRGVSECGEIPEACITYDLARVFLLLRLRRRTRFFLHFALIFDHVGCWHNVSIDLTVAAATTYLMSRMSSIGVTGSKATWGELRTKLPLWAELGR
jgi:hypothetical protein